MFKNLLFFFVGAGFVITVPIASFAILIHSLLKSILGLGTVVTQVGREMCEEIKKTFSTKG